MWGRQEVDHNILPQLLVFHQTQLGKWGKASTLNQIQSLTITSDWAFLITNHRAFYLTVWRKVMR